ncbi:uncharacterized protein H6S33_011063 [Morchella sextelata]|uniref:uncharacterized protein n=1 Tax=Morchella sextelata TaxID=1174677 RepID=UPI001D04B482|nr:uncharacterized protein H6S33_011063 [Morchella sextelata]KAH0611798.1 hypothetical protein H6S33_011063 [Morchella sextelata]
MIKPTVSSQYLRTPKHSYTLPAAPVHLQNTTSAFMSTPNHWAVHERNQPVRETRVVLDLERIRPYKRQGGGFGSGPVSVPFSWMRHAPAFQSKEIRLAFSIDGTTSTIWASVSVVSGTLPLLAEVMDYYLWERQKGPYATSAGRGVGVTGPSLYHLCGQRWWIILSVGEAKGSYATSAGRGGRLFYLWERPGLSYRTLLAGVIEYLICKWNQSYHQTTNYSRLSVFITMHMD